MDYWQPPFHSSKSSRMPLWLCVDVAKGSAISQRWRETSSGSEGSDSLLFEGFCAAWTSAAEVRLTPVLQSMTVAVVLLRPHHSTHASPIISAELARSAVLCRQKAKFMLRKTWTSDQLACSCLRQNVVLLVSSHSSTQSHQYSKAEACQIPIQHVITIFAEGRSFKPRAASRPA